MLLDSEALELAVSQLPPVDLEGKSAFCTGWHLCVTSFKISPRQKTTLARGGGRSEGISTDESREEQALQIPGYLRGNKYIPWCG